MHSAEQFLKAPRGPADILVPTCVRVFDVPHSILAQDALNIIARDQRNHAVIDKIRGAILAPPIPNCDKQNYWRLFLLGDIQASHVHLNQLDLHMTTYFPNNYAPFMDQGPIDGRTGGVYQAKSHV